MAQLTMVDQARLSLRPRTQFVIENYADRRDSTQGGVLSLLRGTLRTFTGLIASANRDKFVKTAEEAGWAEAIRKDPVNGPKLRELLTRR